MGKVKRLRQKYHLSRAKSMSDISTIGKESKSAVDLNCTLPSVSISCTLFDGIAIPLNLNQSLRPDDVRSTFTTKSSFKRENLSKIEKRNLRHKAFMSKLDVIQQLRKDATDRKKRQRTAITGDMRPLADALPSLEEITKSINLPTASLGAKRPPMKQKSVPKAKQRQKNMLRDISAFRKVLADPSYKTDPTGAISNYIQEKIQQELMDEA